MELFQSVKSNKLKSYVIIMLIFLLFSVCIYLSVGAMFGFRTITLYASIVVIVIANIYIYNSLEKLVLSINDAVPLAEENKDLESILEGLSIAAGLPTPKLYQINDPSKNAFATGRNPKRAVICVTTGLIESLEREEIEAVLAHELSHVKNYDTLFAAIVAIYIGTIVIIGDIALNSVARAARSRSRSEGAGMLLIVAVLIGFLGKKMAKVLNLAFSRQREYLADARAVELTRNPGALVSALTKLSQDTKMLKKSNRSTAPMYIVNPIKSLSDFNNPNMPKRRKNFQKSNRNSTHPSIQSRIDEIQNFH